MNLKLKYNNKYDLLIILIIGSISLGVVGGALQITRLFAFFLIFYNLIYFINKGLKAYNRIFIIIGIIWLIIAYRALGWSADKQNGFYQVIYLFIYLNLTYSLLLLGKKSSDPIGCVLKGWLLFFLITVPIGIFEIFTDHHLYTNSIQSNAVNAGETLNGIVGKKYAAVTYNNYNEFMTAISFGLPYLFTSLFYFSDTKYAKYLWYLLASVIIIILVTASRGAIIMLMLCAFLFIIFIKKIYIPNKKRTVKRITIVSILGLTFFSPFLLQQISARLQNTEMAGDPGRLMIYLEAWRLIKKTNYRGLGPYGFEHEWGFAPHNLWLEIFTQYGWLITTIVLLLTMYILIKVHKRFKNKPILSFLGWMIISSLPIITIINSSYLNFSFVWISLGSILIILMNSYKYNQLKLKSGFKLYMPSRA